MPVTWQNLVGAYSAAAKLLKGPAKLQVCRKTPIVILSPHVVAAAARISSHRLIDIYPGVREIISVRAWRPTHDGNVLEIGPCHICNLYGKHYALRQLAVIKTKKTSQGMLRAPHVQCVIDSSARIDRKRRTSAGRAPKSQNFSSFWTPSDRTY